MNIVKVSISFLNKDSDAQLLIDAQGIISAMTNNPNYPTPSPKLADVQAARDAFDTAMAAAADGGVALTAAKNDARDTLVTLLRALASYVQVACEGDLTKLLTSNFPVQKPQRSPVGPVAAPSSLLVSQGAVSGTLNAKFPPVFGASIYNWRLCSAATPTVWIFQGQTTAASTSIDSLTPGTTYTVQANAVGAAGPSDWSDGANLMVV
ncbi:MAG: fibronectin type III domain-containing protein [Verrucomicrobia bacterium]|nr:fibronectin type III domain-containing protein [Verrucomicrobiota bacterium]